MNMVNFKCGERDKSGSCMFKSLVFAFLFMGIFFLFNLSMPALVCAEDDGILQDDVVVQDPGSMQDQGVMQNEVPSEDQEGVENATPPADDGDVQDGDNMQNQENVQTDEEAPPELP